MRSFAPALGILLALVCSSGCGSSGSGSPESAAPRTVVVSLMFPDPAPALPADATLDIRVVEVSGPDRAVVGSLSQASQGPPRTGVEYKLECSGSRIRESQSYGLEVAVVSGGKAILRNKKPYYVLTRGNPDRVQVEVQP
jgi:uncharacterized lipoprotein YbaY